eukprot:scaffold37903_cov16-Prasinocladus_malaysianus.AAC.2
MFATHGVYIYPQKFKASFIHQLNSISCPDCLRKYMQVADLFPSAVEVTKHQEEVLNGKIVDYIANFEKELDANKETIETADHVSRCTACLLY